MFLCALTLCMLFVHFVGLLCCCRLVHKPEASADLKHAACELSDRVQQMVPQPVESSVTHAYVTMLCWS